MTKTVYDVIDFGVSYIRDVYDKWDVMKVLDKDDSVFPNTLHWQYGHVLTVFEEALAMVIKKLLMLMNIVNCSELELSHQIGEMMKFLQSKAF